LIFKNTDDLKSLIKSKFFVLGFLAGIVLLIVLNFVSYTQNFGNGCDDCMTFFGFPFNFIGHGGFVTITQIFWYPFSKNLIIGGVFSFYLGYFIELLARNRLMKKMK